MSTSRESATAADGLLYRSLGLSVLFAFAVAQPIYDLLSRTPEFLAVHGVGAAETLTLVAALSFVVPVAVATAIQLVGRRAPTAARRLYRVAAYLLVGIVLLQIADSRGAEPSRVVWVAVALTTLLVVLDLRTDLLRQFLLLLSPAIFVFPVVFLVSPGARAVLFSPPVAEVRVAAGRDAAPVVFIVFDGLPLTSLLEQARRIDAVRYPAFARLAQTATWFPRATTVADSTLESLPAILTGRLPTEPLPTAAFYPRNLFSLLGDSHEMVVSEPLTKLCPPHLCPDPGLSFMVTATSLAADLSVAYLHLIVPDRLTHNLPQIETGWRNFLAREAATRLGESDRRAVFRAFVDRIDGSAPDALFFLHSELPHAPHEYLPSGEVYTRDVNEPSGEGRQFGWWSDDVWAVRHSYQRHLLQVAFADALLSELLTALEHEDLFDEALIVVTSDHGVSFVPTGSRRMLEAGNAHDVLSVPLLVKLPGQHAGRIDERPVQTIDLLPTITDLFDVDWTPSMDGHSLLDSEWAGRAPTELPEGIAADAFEDQGRLSLQRKLDLFGTGVTDGVFVRTGPAPGLREREAGEWAAAPSARVAVEASIESAPGVIPIQVTGTASGSPSHDGSLCLAIAGDGFVRETTCTYRSRPNEEAAIWSVLLQQPLLDPGSLEIFVIREGQDGPLLERPDG